MIVAVELMAEDLVVGLVTVWVVELNPSVTREDVAELVSSNPEVDVTSGLGVVDIG